jgi:hypothetical protein
MTAITRFSVLTILFAFAGVACAQSSIPDDASGMYSFLKEGEFVQLTFESGKLTGFVSRIGDSDSDRGTVLDHFIEKGSLNGNEITFSTSTIHGIHYEFKGRFERGTAKTRDESGYYVVRGTLTEFSEDANHHVGSRMREVTFKSMPEDVSE